jgi:hypothetical protein
MKVIMKRFRVSQTWDFYEREFLNNLTVCTQRLYAYLGLGNRSRASAALSYMVRTSNLSPAFELNHSAISSGGKSSANSNLRRHQAAKKEYQHLHFQICTLYWPFEQFVKFHL